MEQSHQNDPPDPERLHVMAELASVLEEYIEERRARAAEDDSEDGALEVGGRSYGSVSQADLAEKLADELVACGHESIFGMDILDALASSGLRLSVDDRGAAMEGYFEGLRRHLS